MDKRKIVGLALLLTFSFSVKEVSAENGKLTINNQVIYEQKHEKEDSIEYLIAPDLFLQDKTVIDQENLAKREEMAKQAKEKVFITQQLPETSQAQRAYTKKLFLQDYQGAAEHSKQTSQRSGTLTKGLFYFSAGLLILGMLFLGILLGQKFSTVFVRKN